MWDMYIWGGLFALGVLAQSFFYIFPVISKEEWKNIAISFGIAIAVLLYSTFKNGDSPVNIFLGIIVFAGAFALYFRRRILPVIDESMLLVVIACIWYLFWSYFLSNTILLIIFLVISITTFIVVTLQIKSSFTLKLTLYTLFMILIITYGISQFIDIILVYFKAGNIRDIAHLDFLKPIINGMIFMYLLSYVTYVIALIPIPRKHQTFEDHMKQVKEHAMILSEKYSGAQLSPVEVLFLTAALACLFVVNYTYMVIDPLILTNTVILFAHMLQKKEEQRSLPSSSV